MQGQADLSTGFVGISSIITAVVFQCWLELVEKRILVKQATKGILMKTKIKRQTKTKTSKSVKVATAKTVISVLTGLCGSCLLP